MEKARNGNELAVGLDVSAKSTADAPERRVTPIVELKSPSCQRPTRDRILLAVRGISLSFGGIRALQNVGFEVAHGEIVSIIGPNGAGKTSIANVISGLYHPSSGQILLDGKDRTRATPQEVARLGITRTFQNLALFRGLTVIENILVGRHIHMDVGLLSGGLFSSKARNEERQQREFVNAIIDLLDLGDCADNQADTLPYGIQKRVEFARALALQPSLLLLDEPMAGMSRDEKKAMVDYIATANADLGISIVLIEHDMGVVMDISDWIVVLDHGEKICEGRPEEVRDNSSVIEAYLGQETK
jgi:branched-chain amino acid transport system ATP-binding protein